jgi:putative transposase
LVWTKNKEKDWPLTMNTIRVRAVRACTVRLRDHPVAVETQDFASLHVRQQYADTKRQTKLSVQGNLCYIFARLSADYQRTMSQTDDLFRKRYRIDSARLVGYDYGTNGMYFITICTRNRQPWFGLIGEADPILIPTAIGQIVIDCWQAIPDHFPFVEVDAFQLMPNHLHGIIWINKPDYADWQPNQFGPQSRNLGSIIRGFKIGVTQQARLTMPDFSWQARYHDRVIRDDDELHRIRTYIDANPANWAADRENAAGLFM